MIEAGPQAERRLALSDGLLGVVEGLPPDIEGVLGIPCLGLRGPSAELVVALIEAGADLPEGIGRRLGRVGIWARLKLIVGLVP